MDEAELVARFTRLGVSDPAAFARSQTEEGIPHLHFQTYLRQAWASVIADADDAWIDKELQTPEDGPGGAIVGALQRSLKAGVSRQDLTTVARVMQWQLLSRLCYLASGPAYTDPGAEDVSWCMFATDEEGQPLQRLDGIEEMVLDTDPTGREMRPPG